MILRGVEIYWINVYKCISNRKFSTWWWICWCVWSVILAINLFTKCTIHSERNLESEIKWKIHYYFFENLTIDWVTNCRISSTTKNIFHLLNFIVPAKIPIWKVYTEMWGLKSEFEMFNLTSIWLPTSDNSEKEPILGWKYDFQLSFEKEIHQ